MALQHVYLIPPVQLSTSLAAILDNGSSVKSFVKGVLLHNTDTTTRIVEINWVLNSSGSLGTAAAANRIYRVNLAADETLLLETGSPIPLTAQHDAIFAKADAASKVNIALLGDKE